MKATLVDVVRDSPGIHFRALQRELSCSTSTVEHHLSNSHQVRDRKLRGYRRIYPRDLPTRFDSPLAALNHEPRGIMLCVLHRDGAASFSRLQDHLDQAPSTVSQHLTTLQDAGLVTATATGRSKQYENTTIVTEAIEHHRPSLLDRLAENFASAWGEL